MQIDTDDINLGVEKAVLESQAQSPDNKTSKFTAVLVHELRNPLNNIMLSVESLNDIMGSNEDGKMLMDIIRRNAKRINNLVESMLHQGTINEQKEFSIHRLLEDVLEMVGDRIILKDITVCTNYEQPDFTAIMNEPEMKIALTNLIINAIEAVPTHTGQLNIVVKSVTADDKFCVKIEDNGCGISKKNLKAIFASHFTTKRVGLGYGLAATYAILHSNHVEVLVESKKAVGSCFTLLFDTA